MVSRFAIQAFLAVNQGLQVRLRMCNLCVHANQVAMKGERLVSVSLGDQELVAVIVIIGVGA